MFQERKLADSLREAADALRAMAEAGCDDREREHRGQEPHREHHCCFDQHGELARLGKALLEAVEVVREAATHECSNECDHDHEPCDHHEHCAPPPPYPPYPANPPYAPYPPYPPYPPVVVIGGGGCGCGCAGKATVALPSMAAASSPSVGSTPANGIAIGQPTPFGNQAAILSAVAPMLSARGEFPDPAGIHDMEALLDIGESAAALVKRTLPSGGSSA